MSRRRRAGWLAALLGVMTGVPLLAWWWYAPRQRAQPVELFFPDHLSAAIRLSDLQGAWQRHWMGRPAQPTPPRPEDALQRVLEAMEKWPEWVEDYGAAGARLRLELYQRALFQAIGPEAWLLFGEWGGSAGEGSGEAGFVLLLRGESEIHARIGPLMDLALSDYTIVRTRHEGVTIHEYRDETLARSFAFARVGGWICASMRQHGTGPLPEILNRFRVGGEYPRDVALAGEVPFAGEDAPTTPSAVNALVRPRRLFGHLRQFAAQRGKTFDDDSEENLTAWQQRLEGVDRLALEQSGDSLFDLTLSATGERMLTLSRLLVEDNAQARNVALPAVPPLPGPGKQALAFAQLDASLAAARLIPLTGGWRWEELLEKWGELELWAPGLRRLLAGTLAGDDAAAGRIGAAAFRGGSPLIPDFLLWVDQPPLRSASGSPAKIYQHLAAEGPAAGDADGADRALWVRPLGELSGLLGSVLSPGGGFAGLSLPAPITTGTQGAEPRPGAAAVFTQGAPDRDKWLNLADRLWLSAETPPQAFAAVNFYELAAALNRMPGALLKEKSQRKLARWQRASQGLAFTLGGMVAVLRTDGAEWRLTFETQ